MFRKTYLNFWCLLYLMKDFEAKRIIFLSAHLSAVADCVKGKGSFSCWTDYSNSWPALPDISMSLQRIFPKKCPIMQQSILLHTGPGHALQIWFLLDFLLSDEIGFESLGHLSCTIFKVFSRLRYASPLENL